MGLMLAEPGFHTRAFVEWEEYPRQAIIAAQATGSFAPAPIWDDLRSFDGRPFRGAFDTILAGYPCQPFSQAGKRLGADDERHLWPDVARIIGEVEPEWVFLENVPGHVTLGAETVLRELWDMGFTPAVGLFSAAEVGAPHERLRVFIVGHSVANAHGRHARAEREQRGGEQRLLATGGGTGDGNVDDASRQRRQQDARGAHGDEGADERRAAQHGDQPTGAVKDVDHTASARRDGAGIGSGAIIEGGQRLSCDGRDAMADACQPGPQGREQPGSPGQRHRAPAPRSAAERGGLPLFPPGPADRDAWAAVMAASPDRAPSFARRDVIAAAVNLAAVLPADKAEAIEPALRSIPRGAGMAAVVREAPALVDKAQALTGLRNLADGLAGRTRALRLLGNGVHPLAAAHAWRTLAVAHGLGPVDLEAACLGSNASPDDDGVVM